MGGYYAVYDITDFPNTAEAFKNITLANRVHFQSFSTGNAPNSSAHDLGFKENGNPVLLSFITDRGFFAQEMYTPVYYPSLKNLADVNDAAGNLPAIINDNGATRSAAYNGEKVFVASRQGGNRIYHWNVSDLQAAPAELDMTDVAGGTWAISDVQVTGNQVLASNMVMSADQVFKIYHWADLTAQPTVLLSFTIPSGVRLGDSFTFFGDPTKNAVVMANNFQTKSFYVWNITDGVVAATPEVVTIDALSGAGNFLRVTGVPNEELFVVAGSGLGIALIDDQQQVVFEMEKDLFPGWSMYAHVFYFNQKRHLAYMSDLAYFILDISEGATVKEGMQSITPENFASKVVYKKVLGQRPNGNASVSLNVIAKSGGAVEIMAFAAGNGFVVDRFAMTEETPKLDVNFVVKDEAGADIADAVVTFNGNALDAGVYQVKDLIPGSYNFSVSKAGYVDFSGMATVVFTNISINVVLELKTYKATFTVKSAQGTDITDAIITFDGVAAAAGTYVFDKLAPGTYPYIVSKTGYFPKNGTLTITNDDVTEDVVLAIDNTSVNPNLVNQTRIFPNPASHQVKIEAVDNITAIMITDLTGRQVYNQVVNHNQHQLNTDTFENGIYLVRIYTDKGVAVQKLQISK